MKYKQGIHDWLIVVAFNSPFRSGLDYAPQTMKILSRSHTVIGFSLGEPITWRSLLSGSAGPLVQKKYNYWLMRPFFIIPGMRFKIVMNINYAISASILFAYCSVRYFHKKKLLWFFEPFYMPLLLTVFHGYKSLYDCVDYFDAFSEYASRCHKLMLQKATIVTANSSVLLKQLHGHRADIHLVPLGFASDEFKRIPMKRKRRHDGNVVIGYVGGINFRLDYSLLINVAKRLPSAYFEFVGQREHDPDNDQVLLSKQISDLFSLPNVIWRKPVAKNKIAGVIARFDVCIIPYDTSNLFNRYCFPMKVMEYFSLGKPVVSTSIRELYQYKDVLQISKTAESFVKSIRMLIRHKDTIRMKNRRKEIAASHSWDNKVNMISEVIAQRTRTPTNVGS